MNKKMKWGIIALIGIGIAGMAIHAFLPRENKELAQAPTPSPDFQPKPYIECHSRSNQRILHFRRIQRDRSIAAR